jgi:hypothetical protein
MRLTQLAHVAIDEDAVYSLWANRAVISALQCRRYEKDSFLNLNDVPTRTDYVQRWTQSWEKLHDDLEHLKATCLLREEKQKVDSYAAAAKRYRQEIPLSARIVALADVYDALTSRRVYKPPYSPDAAREIIIRDSGSHFDPVIVDAFLTRFNDFQKAGTQATEQKLFEVFGQENALSTVPV